MQKDYELVRSRRKTLSIIVKKDAVVQVRAPLKTPQEQIEAFVQKHSGWIEKHQARLRQSAAERGQFTGSDGDVVYFFGEPLTLVTAAQGSVCAQNGALLLPDGVWRVAAVESFLRREAAAYLPGRLEHFSRLMDVQPTGCKITSARTRWGSCSGKNSICFSHRLVCLPPALIDAVVVHELAHIREKNHSERFYREVCAILPDYRQRHGAMKEFAEKLTI